jgi:hypothetical protein
VKDNEFHKTRKAGFQELTNNVQKKIEIGRLSCWKPIVKSDLNDKKYGKEK